MTILSDFFKKQEVCFEKLQPFGFKKEQKCYVYQRAFFDQQFLATFYITSDGKVSGQVIDNDLGEVYQALEVESQQGSFVRQVRKHYLDLLSEIADACFKPKLFLSDQGNWLANRIQSDFNDSYDHPFEKHPQYISYRVHQKWYALIFPLEKGKLIPDLKNDDFEEIVEVINLKVNASRMDQILKKEGIYPSYHMSKKTWISIILDDKLSNHELYQLVKESRELVNPKPLSSQGGPDYWVIPANLKYYDIDAEFSEDPVVLWTQKASIKKNDFVIIYITAPTKAVRYICQVLESDIPNEGYRENPNIKTLMRLKMIVKLNDDQLTFDKMSSLGVKAVRGPRRITPQLIAYLHKMLAISDT